MKKMKYFSFLVTLLFFNISLYSNVIVNTGYLLGENIQKSSNKVRVDVLNRIIKFKTHSSNISEQNLSAENKISVVGELDLTNFNTSFFYFKLNIYSRFYPYKSKFYLQEDGTEEFIEIPKESDILLKTKLIEIMGGKKYKIVVYGTDIKNAVNLDEGYFSLEAFHNGSSLGEVKNKLFIDYSIQVAPSGENESVQQLSVDGILTANLKINFKNLLKEKIRLKIKLSNDILVNEVIGKIGDLEVKFYLNEKDGTFYSDEIEVDGEILTDIFLNGAKAVNNSKIGEFRVSVLIGDIDCGGITNTVILESKNKILLEKKVKQKSARVGDLIKYTLDVKISDDESFKSFIFRDFLPRGFDLIEESIKVSKGTINNLKKEKGNTFSFEIKFLEKYFEETLLTIEYMVKVGVTSKHGKNINRAVIYGNNNVNPTSESNLASVGVNIDTENFSEKGIILGLIYLDLDLDNKYDSKKDKVIPGVKIFLENGDFAITDENGKYSIFGEDATTHIAKIDRKSLIKGIKGVKLTSKHSENGESQFVDLKKSQLYTANFAFQLEKDIDSENILKKIETRKKFIDENTKKEHIYNVESKELSFKGTSTVTEKKEIGEKGTINSFAAIEFKNKPILPDDETSDEDKKVVVEDLRGKFNILTAEQLTNDIEKLDNALDIMNISNGDVVLESMTFQIKAPSGGIVNLYVNNKEVDINHIGLRASSALNSLFFLEYSSVKLEKGKNTIKASFLDPFGIERASVQKEVLVRGELSKIKFEKLPKNENEDDIEKFIVKGTDENGLDIPYSLNTTILESGGGEWVTADRNSAIRGLQIVIPPNSESEIYFRPDPGKKKIKFNVTLETVEKEFEFEVFGKTEELFVNGLIEGRINLKAGAAENYFFEKKINNLYKDKINYRGAVFAQGHVKDEYYLTMTYDSNKEDEKFFAYENPDEYYPIYGDNSIKGYIGESKEDLYIKIEKQDSYVMYGDYKTSNMFDDRLRLNEYSRTLTGASSSIKEGNFQINTFIAKTSSQKVIEEIQGKGLSGPYNLSNRNILEGSEEVNLIIYSKKNGTVLSETSLSRGQSYTIDYDLGRIYFSEPIMGYDSDFNPLFIKINYEVSEDDGDKYFVYGVNTEYDITSKIKIGTSYINDENTSSKYEMNGIYMVFENEKNRFTVEAAQTKDFENKIGTAASIHHKYKNENLEVKTIYEKADKDYSNSDSKASSGVEKLETNLEYKLKNESILKLEINSVKDENSSGAYEKNEIYYGIQLPKKGEFTYEIGGKYYYKKDSMEVLETNTVGGKVIWEPEDYERFRGFLEYEQDISLTENRRIASGFDYTFDETTGFYLRQEIMSNLGEHYYLDPEDESNRTLLGIRSSKYFNSEIFSEYREKNSDNKILPEVGYGFKRNYELNENLTIYGTFERIDPVSKKIEDENERKSSTSLTVGYDYEMDSLTRIKGDLEFEFGSKNSFLNKFGYGRKINKSLYFIGKNRYYTEGENKEENRLLLGLAYRDDSTGEYSSLNKYEMNYSSNIIDDNYKQLTHILRSSHSYKINENFDTTMTLGAKNIRSNYENIATNYSAYLVAGTLNYSIFENWTAGINLATLFDSEKNIDYGLGFELGYIFKSNLWLSLGYNFVGFRDKDFDPNGELAQGLFLRFRMNIGDMFDRFKENGKKEPPEKVEIVDVYNLPKEK